MSLERYSAALKAEVAIMESEGRTKPPERVIVDYAMQLQFLFVIVSSS